MVRKFVSERVNYDDRLHTVYHDAAALDDPGTDRSARLFGSFIERSSEVVDVGSGTGRWSRLLAERLDAMVIGVEPSANMRAEATRVSAHPQVTYVEGAGESLPLDDASVDVGLISRVVHHFLDLNAAAREVARVVRPGGLCLIVAVFGDRLNDESPLYRFWPELRRIDQSRFPPLRDVLVAFRDAGFSDITVEPVVDRINASLSDYRVRAAQRGLSKFEYLTADEFARGLTGIDLAIATDEDGPVFDRMEVVVLRRRPAPLPDESDSLSPHTPGETATLREFYSRRHHLRRRDDRCGREAGYGRTRRPRPDPTLVACRHDDTPSSWPRAAKPTALAPR